MRSRQAPASHSPGGILGLIPIATVAVALLLPGAARAAEATCTGDGTSGKRVEVIYGHVDGQPLDANAKSLITGWAAGIQKTFDLSAERNGGGPLSRARPRWLFTGPCGGPGSELSVQQVNLPATIGTSFNALRVALGANPDNPTFGAQPGTLAANRDRKYLVFLDLASCGGPTSDFLPDSDPNPDTNVSNQNPGTGFDRAMIARYCHGSWDDPVSDDAINFGLPHELVHLLGGVNPAAPHGYFGHCWDQYDVMCTNEDPAHQNVLRCTEEFVGLDPLMLLDCGGDDYFSMAPAPGSYLASCWNLARSNFLDTTGVAPAASNPALCGGRQPPPPPPPVTGERERALKKCKKKKSKKKRKKCRKRAKKLPA